MKFLSLLQIPAKFRATVAAIGILLDEFVVIEAIFDAAVDLHVCAPN